MIRILPASARARPWRALLALLATLLLPWARGAQAVPAPRGHLLPSPLVFLRNDAGLSAADLGALEQGRVIARVVDTGDASEVLAVGAVRLHTTTLRVLAQVKAFEGRRRPGDILQAGLMGREPSAQDLAGLTLDNADLGALSRCQPGTCDLRLSAGAIQRFRREVDWSSPRRAQQASALWHEVLAGLARDYLTHGNAALFEYVNNDMPVKVGESLARVLDRSGYLADSAPDLHRYLLRFPEDRPSGVEEYLYWLKEKFWIKTVVSLNHVVVTSGEDAGSRYVLAASKQIYANRYYESSVSLTVFVEGAAGTYLVYISRSRADIRPTGFNFFERILLRRLVSGRLDAQLRWVRDVLEAPAKASADADGQHRDGPAVHALHGVADRLSRTPRAQHVEEREVVVRRGRGQHGVPAQALVGHEGAVLAGEDQLAGAGLEADGPIEGLHGMAAPGVGVEVVDEVPAAHHEDAFVAQGGEPAAEVVVERARLRLVDGELDDGDVGLGEGVAEDGPGPVVEPPVEVEAHAQRGQEALDTAGQIGIPRGRILHRVELAREAAEVVDGARTGHGRDPRPGQVPVGGDAHDRARTGQRAADGAPGLRVAVALDRVHGVPVAEEDGGHHGNDFRTHAPDAPVVRARCGGTG